MNVFYRINKTDEFIYIYTYNEEYQHIPTALSVIIIIILLANYLVGLPTNCVMLYAIASRKRLENRRNVFVGIMAVIDILFCAVYGTASMEAIASGRVHKSSCHLASALQLFLFQTKLTIVPLIANLQVIRIKISHKEYTKLFNWGFTVTLVVLTCVPGLFHLVPTLTGVLDLPLTWDPAVASCTRDSEAVSKLLDSIYGSPNKTVVEVSSTARAISHVNSAVLTLEMITLVVCLVILTIYMINAKRASWLQIHAVPNVPNVPPAEADAIKDSAMKVRNKSDSSVSVSKSSGDYTGLFPDNQVRNGRTGYNLTIRFTF